MNIQYNDYVIDFDRVNELTSHKNDTGSTNGLGSVFMYNPSRKIIKDYLDIYTSYNGINNYRGSRITHDDYNRACEVLNYNKILLSRSDLRDTKINDIFKNV